MTRHTITTIPASDGGAFRHPNRPPVDAVPAAFKPAFAEFDKIWGRLAEARGILSSINDTWTERAEQARKADISDAREAARKEQSAPVAHAHTDALNAQLARAKADVAALEGALALVEDDLAAVRETEQKRISTYQAAEDKAREQLAKALEAIQPAATNLARAIAIREWIANHTPWDDSTNLRVEDLWEPIGNMNPGSALNTPVRLPAVITALRNL